MEFWKGRFLGLGIPPNNFSSPHFFCHRVFDWLGACQNPAKLRVGRINLGKFIRDQTAEMSPEKKNGDKKESGNPPKCPKNSGCFWNVERLCPDLFIEFSGSHSLLNTSRDQCVFRVPRVIRGMILSCGAAGALKRNVKRCFSERAIQRKVSFRATAHLMFPAQPWWLHEH